MIRPEKDLTSITKMAQAAFSDVQQSVIMQAKQTHTPIIVFTDNRIQSLPADQFERIELEKLSEQTELGERE